MVEKKGYILKFSMELIGYKYDHDHDQGGSKNVKNSEKDAKIVGGKGYILKFIMELIENKHDHDHYYGG